jgi:virginiamycin A acetyltransferase
MNITTSDDCVGVLSDHLLSKHFSVYGYQDGAFSLIPHDFFQDWKGEEAEGGSFHFGRCSFLGSGSIAKYGPYEPRLIVGRNVSGGSRLRFQLNAQHDMRSISTRFFGAYGDDLMNRPPLRDGDTILHNDIWIGDEALFMGGSIIESGCVIGARTVIPGSFRSEPYGIYVGSPARLVRFRFPEKVREKLLELAWWDMPLSWIKENNSAFLADLSMDEGRSLELLTELQREKTSFINGHVKYKNSTAPTHG